ELSTMATEGNLTLISSILGTHGDGVANTMPVFGADGEMLGVYRKLHLFRLFDEDKYLVQGTEPLTLDLAWGKIGFAICYDLRFPELFRHYAVSESASVIVLVAEWPLVRVEHWRSLLIARAIENQCYIIACNAVGDTGNTIMAGHSMIIDPWGRIVVEAGETPQLITADIDLGEVAIARSKIPIFDDVRHDIYG
ncbi:MAG: nitrilase-related carbon-nitrogen hydrolase, partial [Chloroflexota bacterium]